MTPQIGDKRTRFGQTWVVLGYGQIVRDYIVLVQSVDTGERDYALWSEVGDWRVA